MTTGLHRDDVVVTIPEHAIKRNPFIVSVRIADNQIFTMGFIRNSDGSLYYRVEEVANPEFVIEGHYPEYFDEE